MDYFWCSFIWGFVLAWAWCCDGVGGVFLWFFVRKDLGLRDAQSVWCKWVLYQELVDEDVELVYGKEMMNGFDVCLVELFRISHILGDGRPLWAFLPPNDHDPYP